MQQAQEIVILRLPSSILDTEQWIPNFLKAATLYGSMLKGTLYTQSPGSRDPKLSQWVASLS